MTINSPQSPPTPPSNGSSLPSTAGSLHEAIIRTTTSLRTTISSGRPQKAKELDQFKKTLVQLKTIAETLHAPASDIQLLNKSVAAIDAAKVKLLHVSDATSLTQTTKTNKVARESVSSTQTQSTIQRPESSPSTTQTSTVSKTLSTVTAVTVPSTTPTTTLTVQPIQDSSIRIHNWKAILNLSTKTCTMRQNATGNAEENLLMKRIFL